MKRTEQPTSPASAATRPSASGSRSIATSVPDGPRRSATARACPPSPKVQSIAVWPGRGSSISSSSTASTGMCPGPPPRGPEPAAACARTGPVRCPRGGRRPDRLISVSVVDTRSDLRDAAQQRRLVVAPSGLAPQLEAVADPDDHDLLLQSGALAETDRDHHSSGGIELGLA